MQIALECSRRDHEQAEGLVDLGDDRLAADLDRLSPGVRRLLRGPGGLVVELAELGAVLLE